MTEREQFEAWWNSKPWPPGASAWDAWQARAALSQQAEPVALEHLCGVLPAETYWGDPITPDVVRHILSVGPPYAAPPDDEAVRLLREARRHPWKLQAVELEPVCVEPAQEFQAAIDAYLAKVNK